MIPRQLVTMGGVLVTIVTIMQNQRAHELFPVSSVHLDEQPAGYATLEFAILPRRHAMQIFCSAAIRVPSTQ